MGRNRGSSCQAGLDAVARAARAARSIATAVNQPPLSIGTATRLLAAHTKQGPINPRPKGMTSRKPSVLSITELKNSYATAKKEVADMKEALNNHLARVEKVTTSYDHHLSAKAAPAAVAQTASSDLRPKVD